MNCLRLYFIYEYSSISITYYVTEILVYKFVIYKGLEFWLICLNESVIDQDSHMRSTDILDAITLSGLSVW